MQIFSLLKSKLFLMLKNVGKSFFFSEQTPKCINCPDWTPHPVTLLSFKNAININKMWLLFLASAGDKVALLARLPLSTWFWLCFLLSLLLPSWFSFHQLLQRSLQVSSLLPRCILSSHLFHNNSTIYPVFYLRVSLHCCLLQDAQLEKKNAALEDQSRSQKVVALKEKGTKNIMSSSW